MCSLRLQPAAQGVGRWAGPGPMCPGWGREPWKVAIDYAILGNFLKQPPSSGWKVGRELGRQLTFNYTRRQAVFLPDSCLTPAPWTVSSETRQTAVGLLRGRSWVISRPRCGKYSGDTSALKMCGCPHSLFPGFPCRMQQLGSTLKRCLHGCPAAVLFNVPISPLPKQILED